MAREKKPVAQLPLHLPLDAAQAREDLIVSDANRKAVAFLDAWPDWPGPLAVLAGPVGCGKTHLAQIWSVRTGARFQSLPNIKDMTFRSGEPVIIEDLAQGSTDRRLCHRAGDGCHGL